MSADELLRLAALAARLSPDHRNPEQFHLEKSELISGLRKLASAPDGIRQSNDGSAMKHANIMTESEYRENRRRIRCGLPPLFEVDDRGQQTLESKAAIREHRALAEARTLERIKRRCS